MNADYVRQVAAECDAVIASMIERGDSYAESLTTITRAAAVLHMVVSAPQIAQERLNGSGSVEDTGDTRTGHQGTTERP